LLLSSYYREIIRNASVWLEKTGIFVIWVSRLVYVFNHLREQIDEDAGELADEPAVSFDDENV